MAFGSHRGKQIRGAAPRTLAKRVVGVARLFARRAVAAELTGEAAKVAYFFFLSLFPMVIVLFAFTGIIGREPAFRWVMARLRSTMPGDAAVYLEGFVRDVTSERRPGLLSIGLLLSIWTSSSAFDWLTRALNVTFGVAEQRPWWKRRLLALAAMVTTLVVVTLSSIALLSGPHVLARIGFERHWTVLRWPVAWLLISATMWLIYRLLPGSEEPGAQRSLLVGASVGSGLWLLATLGFRAYVAHFGNYGASYGAVGGVIVLLLWLYLTALAILLGAEVAATIERAERRP